MADLYRHYWAPRSNQEAFSEPSIGGAASLIHGNQVLLAQHGDFWQAFRQTAREQMISDAIRYTSAYRDVDVQSDQASAIVMAGHQPSLFHSGVWFKNFALSRVAERHNAFAVNLVIDNDVASGSAIRVPTIDAASGECVYRSIRYDRFGGGVPYEQTIVSDRERFDRFDLAVSEAVSPLVADPLVSRLWQHARSAIDRCGVAGCALAQARHSLEGDVGLRTLELPLGVLCRSVSFSQFLLMILCDAARFQEIYNSEASRYRAYHGIRSAAHPVPNLGRNDGWLEAPIWIYSDASPQRKPGWVKRTKDELIISDRGSQSCKISLRGSLLDAAEPLTKVIANVFKIRPRALLTTMYARLVLSDLFLHGIGGGKYDQLGDRIAERFFSIQPPGFMVVSATVLLPGVSQCQSTHQEIADLKRSIRDTHYHGERFSEQVGLDEQLIQRKKELLAHVAPKGQKSRWHAEISAINHRLASQLQATRGGFASKLAMAQRRLGSESILMSREHPFCVFPLRYLVETYQRLLAEQSARKRCSVE